MSFNHCITIPVTLIMIVDSLGRVHTGYFLRAANALQTSMSLLYYFFIVAGSLSVLNNTNRRVHGPLQSTVKIVF